MNRPPETIAFQDAEVAQRTLDALAKRAGPAFLEPLAHELEHAANADRVLVRLERFLDLAPDADEELRRLAASLRYLRLAARLFDQSAFLTDIVFRNPGYLAWLHDEAALAHERSRESLIEEASAAARSLQTYDERARAIRRLYRREILRIGAREIFEHAPVTSVTADLANLADAVLAASLNAAQQELERRFGRPRQESGAPVTFAILGMGKLGGSELNFSSDIDLLFVYSAEGRTGGGTQGTTSNAEYYHKLGTNIIKLLTEHTEDGSMFRVDMRLRPHGSRGPLASNVDSCVNYYERAGQAWERQALIKTRTVAGDQALGEYFIERTRPFVFPRYFDDDTLDEIRTTKQQAEAQIRLRQQTGREVKRGYGGIRDIEFTVQMLQMLNGGRYPELRARNALEAIAALGRLDFLRPFEATTLAANYTFLRQVEHRLQIEGSQQRHLLPELGPGLDDFARRLGYDNGDTFFSAYQARCAETRAILERFLSTEGAGNLWITDLLNARSDGEAGLPRLAELGFKDGVRARSELLLLSAGPSERPNSLHVRQQFAAIGPQLLQALSTCVDPDETLLRLGRVIANLRAPSVIYDLLRWNPGLISVLVVVVENSPYLTELLIQDPGLFETFGAPGALDAAMPREALEEELRLLQQAYESDSALYRFQRGQTLRIGMRELLTNAGVVEIGKELTEVAEVCLQLATWLAREKAAARFGPADAAFAVLALGKLGGNELGYGSDLDLAFVYDDTWAAGREMALFEHFNEVASQVIRTLKEPAKHGRIYDIDPRLRPDGAKGVLCVGRGRFIEYYKSVAEAWERLALAKVRSVCGEPEFGSALEQEAQRIAFQTPLTRQDLDRIEELRQKLENTASPCDLKKSRGGLAELEYTVRLLQHRHSGDVPELMRGDVLGALDLLERRGLLSSADVATLRSTYLLFRRIENRLRLAEGRPTSTLPEKEAARADLALRLGIDENLINAAAERREKVHALYEAARAAAAQIAPDLPDEAPPP